MKSCLSVYMLGTVTFKKVINTQEECKAWCYELTWPKCCLWLTHSMTKCGESGLYAMLAEKWTQLQDREMDFIVPGSTALGLECEN